MSKKLLLSALVAASLSPVATQADTLGVFVGVNAWQTDLEGDFGNMKNLEDRGFFDKEVNTSFWAALEHPVPMLPNIRIVQTTIEHDIKGESFDFDYSHTDATLYYEVLDNVIELDLGLTARMNDLNVEDGKNDELLPLLYVKGQFNLPVTGLSLAGTVQQGGGSDKSSDVDVAVMYESSLGLGGALGYRTLNMEAELKDGSDKLKTDITFDGMYASVFFHF